MGAPVGWVVLNPTSETLAATGGFFSPATALLLGGVSLASLGILALGLFRRRLAV